MNLFDIAVNVWDVHSPWHSGLQAVSAIDRMLIANRFSSPDLAHFTRFPVRNVGIRSQLVRPFVVRQLPPSPAARVLLTFDDGPVPGATEAILELLARYEVTAAFFMIGKRAAQHPHLVREVLASGHILGNHGYHHDMSHWPSVSLYISDLDRCSDTIESVCGQPPVAFRAPGGRIHLASIVSPRRRGLPHVLWSLDPRDYLCTDADTSRKLGQSMVSVVRPRDIVLLHDTVSTTPALLENLLPGLLDRGFELGGPIRPLSRKAPSS